MIYFIQDDGVFHIKIGFSFNPEKRLKDLQTGCPSRLTLLATMPGSEAGESALHNRFAKYHVHGDWFKPGPELLLFLISEPALHHKKLTGLLTRAHDVLDGCLFEMEFDKDALGHKATRPMKQARDLLDQRYEWEILES